MKQRPEKTADLQFASSSVPIHVARGLVGIMALGGALPLVAQIGAAGLLLLPIGVLAFRGCPTCWAIGLAQTISRGRLQRSCTDGKCSLAIPSD